ncbi:MAG TPA: HAD family hydrolase [Candidatus Dormibacteraeota bacterium]|nr:HAD family hydrolase [Candidatus Dormibacteraeota bacterium]
MPRALEVALVDVGGTLWPNSWPIRQADSHGRRKRIAAAMDGHDASVIDRLADDLLKSSKPGDEARTVTTESVMAVGAAELIAGCLARQGLAQDEQTVSRIRRAMAIPIHDAFKPLPGALDLLRTIRELGLRTVIASNTYWRDADSYWDDFRALGMAEYIDGIITSVDAGHLKPHPAVFEMAMRWAGVPAGRCVVIGNREENDVDPALALGMRTILVYPDDPTPAASRAHAMAPDLWACARVLRDMLDPHEG